MVPPALNQLNVSAVPVATEDDFDFDFALSLLLMSNDTNQNNTSLAGDSVICVILANCLVLAERSYNKEEKDQPIRVNHEHRFKLKAWCLL
jgi:hypothetical protein